MSGTALRACCGLALSLCALGCADGGGPPATDMIDQGVGQAGAASCGDMLRSETEQCDGADLNGSSCALLGMGTGQLMCDTVSCTYDTSMCTPTAPTTPTVMGGGGAGGQL